ncbi:hypothetical protein AR454_09695 [Bacillus mycoides]|uniref:hypothetical protein n=1 Tax=Bacillus mycoides TaxID=1405 RepID=UPI001E65C50E|nr:hypothetical protein [Bacillus mycoides]MCD4647392.1 hypothetical protein [Bacillus mycoides]
MSQFKKDPHIPFQCAFPLPEGPNGLRQFKVGVNSASLPNLTSPIFVPLSTVSITINSPNDIIRFMATIQSQTLFSSVSSTPLNGTVVGFRIRRIAPAATIQSVQNTDFDELTTTFTAFNKPGVGTFFYVLEGNLVRRTNPPNTLIEGIVSVILTAEEIALN